MKIPESIGPFSLDKSPTTMKYGYYYRALFDIPFSKEKRYVRVWLPENYFNNQKQLFPVIYFADGQNLVNQKLCAFGCWKLDLVAHDLLIKESLSFIAVGVDSPKDAKTRFLELNPPYMPERIKEKAEPYGNQFVDYLADSLVPLINQSFHTKVEKGNIGIAGSSMGGIMAFYAGVKRFDTFGFSMDFSPAFFLYKKTTWDKLLELFQISPLNNVKHFFYVGGVEFEKQFINPTKATYQYLKSQGFDDSQVKLLIDSSQRHNEEAWHKYLKDALLFWLKQ